MRADHLAMAGMNRTTQYYTQPSNNSAVQDQKTIHPDKQPKGQDRVNISPLQKMNSMIATLKEQKENIVKAKGELAAYARETGQDYDAIKGRMESYDEMLKNLDTQIADVYAQQTKAAIEKVEGARDKKKTGGESQKTKEELEAERLSNLASASDSAKQTKTVSAVKDKLEGEAKVLKGEVKLGRVYVETLKSRAIGSDINVADLINHEEKLLHKKGEAITELLDTAEQASLTQAKKLGEERETLDEGEAASTVKPHADTPVERDKEAQRRDAAVGQTG